MRLSCIIDKKDIIKKISRKKIMWFMRKFVALMGKGDYLTSSNITTISTKFGVFKVKAYKYENSEYLVLMSMNFSDLKDPIVYIHTGSHIHNDPKSNIHYLNNEIDSILKLIRKVGGLMIFPSSDGENIDQLLKQINAKKLESGENKKIKEKIELGFKVEQMGYRCLCLILKNLNLSSIKLITSDIKLVALVERLEISIVKKLPAISFEYGKQKA